MAPRPEVNWLAWTWEALGPFYGMAFLALSGALAILLVAALRAFRRGRLMPVDLVERLDALLRAGSLDEARQLAAADESLLGAMMAAALCEVRRDPRLARGAASEAAEPDEMAGDHRLSCLALVGTVSPMIGLLGTVQGMIASFSLLSVAPVAPRPDQLAGGISTALFTTLVGLGIAIPAVAAHNVLRNRADRLVHDVHAVAEGLLDRVAGVPRPAPVPRHPR
jgi:biopolymer transport protein ExbB